MERVLDPRDYGTFGLGCWAIGGPFSAIDGSALGWGEVDDDESIAATHCALDLSVRIYDTADVCGAGHSEHVLGKAFGDRRSDVLVVSKSGNVFDERTKRLSSQSCEPDHIRAACAAPLARLGNDYLDVLLLHMWDIEDEQVDPVTDTLEDLVAAGRIRSHGWSTDQPHRIARMAQAPNCSSVEIALTVLNDSPEIVPMLAELGLVAFIRSPLAMGLLAGRITRDTVLAEDDIRGSSPSRASARWPRWSRMRLPATSDR